MTRAKGDLTRVHLQDQIVAKFGQARIDELKRELCATCAFREMHGHPCHLLPITLEGKNCEYHSTGDQYPKEVV